MAKTDKRHKKRINLKPFLYFFVFAIPIFSYFFFVLHYTNSFMLSTDGYAYIWFWNILLSGKFLHLQLITPSPLLVFLYGLLATPNLLWIELLKVLFMFFMGYGIFKLTLRITKNHILSLFGEILFFILPFTIKNMAFGTDIFIAATFIIWSLYFYIEEHFYLTSLLLLLGGLTRQEVWIVALFLILHSIIAYKKCKCALLLALLSPLLWLGFDFFLSHDPFYSFKVLGYYFSITGAAMLTSKQVITGIYNTLKTSYSVYILITLLLTLLFSFIKRRYETILLATLSIVLVLTISLISIYTGFFSPRQVFIPIMPVLLLIPFFTESILSFAHPLLSYIVFFSLITISFYALKNTYRNIKFGVIEEKNKEEAAREIAPQVSVISDKRVLMPYRRIGMFSYLNGKDYEGNIFNEFDLLRKKISITHLDYIVFISDDFDPLSKDILTPILPKNTEKDKVIRNIVIQNLYTTPNGLGKIFKIFVSKETQRDQTTQE